MSERETPYTAARKDIRFWVCHELLDSGEPVAWVAASCKAKPDFDGCWVMGPYDTAAEALGVCKRLREIFCGTGGDTFA